MALTRPKFYQVDTTITAFNDPITVLRSGATQANVDVGFLFNRANGLVSNVALVWSEATQSFITAYTDGTGATNSNISVSSYANVRTGNITANGFFWSNGTVFSSGSTFAGGYVQNTIIAAANLVANSGTASSSTTTGALVVAGGAGISGNIWSSGRLAIGDGLSNPNIANVLLTTATSGNAAYRAINLIDTGGVIKIARIGNNPAIELQQWDSTISTLVSYWDIASVVNGTFQIRDRSTGTSKAFFNILQPNGNIVATSTTTSTDINTGAFVVKGGVGISGALNVGANITVTGSILPSANVTYNLGSHLLRWKDLYLSGTTIDIGGATISVANGEMTLSNPAGGSFSVGGSSSYDLTGIDANLGTVTTNITTLFTNAATQAGSLTTLTANAAAQAGQIQTLDANLGTATTNITTLFSNAAGQANQITGANAAIVTANTGLKSYVDTQDSAITTAWTANAAGQANQITGANAAIVTANSAVVSFVGMINSNLSTAITANTNAANTAATTANTNMKSYVDTQDSAITTAWTSNAATQATSINTINANIGSYYQYANANLGTATTNITTLFSNAATQATSINSINANLGTATTNITNLQSNAGTQQSQINSIVTNANANVAAYLPTYSGSLGGTLTTAAQTNITSVGTLTGLTSSGIVNITNSTQSSDNTTGALVVTGGAAVGANLHVGGSLHITGNLEVNGTQTIFNTNVSVIEDSMIYLGDDNTGDSVDIGIVSSFTNPAYQHTGFVRDASDGVWKLFANVVAEPTTVVDFTSATYSPLKVGRFTANGNVNIDTGINGNAFIISGPGGSNPNFIMSGPDEQTFRFFNSNSTAGASTRVSWKLAHSNNIAGGSQDWAWIMYTDRAGNGADDFVLQKRTAGVAMYIDASANVGLGGNVAPQHKLSVNGTLYASGNAVVVGNLNVGGTLNTFSGNVGIGAIPDANFHVSSGSAKLRIGLTSSSQYLDIYRENSTGFTVYNAAQADPFRAHIWQLGGTEAMRIATSGNVAISTTTASTSSTTGALVVAGGAAIAGNLNVGGVFNTFSGNVGIGNTAPVSKLHVQGATSGDGGSFNGTGSALYVKQDTTWSGNQPWALYVSGYSYLNGFRINASDGIRALYKTSAGGSLGFATTGDDPITFTQSDSSERMRIAVGGNVVINTTTTSTSTTTGALVVKGGVGVAGQVTAGNIVTTSGVYWANGAAYSSGSGGGITYTASATAPGSPSAGNFWYDTSTDTKYQYIYDGAGSYWEDLSYPTSFGNLTVANTLTVGGSIVGTTTNANYSLAANVAIYESVTATTTNATFYPMLSGITTGNTASFTSSSLVYNPSTGNLVVASTTASTSTTTGALVVRGGVGIAGATQAAAITSSGTIIASTVNAGTIGNSGATLTGTISTAAQTNITSVGTLLSLGVSGLITGRTGAGGVAAVSNDAGSLSVRGDATNAAVISFHRPSLYAINMGLDTDNVFKIGGWSATANCFQLTGAGALTLTGGITTTGNILPSANLTYNLGSTTAWWNNVYGVSVQAKYADLAEHYTADDLYGPGTVVVFGGAKEITVSNISHDPRVAGVISTNPAYLMNAANAGLPVALTGRVPCQVQGPVAKGDRLVNIDTGVAGRLNPALHEYGCIIGKSLGEIADDSIQTIEIVVGRF